MEFPEISLSSTYLMGRQAIWYTLAIPVIIGILFFDYQKLKNRWMYLYGIGLLIHLYLHFFGYTVNGAKKWISLSGLTVDGTMLSLFFFFLAWAGIFNKINEFHSWKKQGFLFVLFWIPIITLHDGAKLYGWYHLLFLFTRDVYFCPSP